ncbi:Hypothetical predicted protein [Cloeon dipterum]|uniref:Major facilitator superfamily (MFS) profile domain-containing protein n=1 Tax=Cloeon dipterum TaxID=197152 RepID=A0A8S1DVL0_9INSE|nr:Hypothetical predicted protein [Cloeon dipterum]
MNCEERRVSFGADGKKHPSESDAFISKGVQRNTSRSSFREIRAAVVANLAVIHLGLMFSFSAMTLPEMKAADSILRINDEQASWIASIASLATPPGCLFGAYLMDQRGRKYALVFLSVPCVLGWLSVGFAGLATSHVSNDLTLYIIYGGRMLQGFGTGIAAGSARVYTSETSTPYRRGTLTSLASLAISLGVLTGYSLGALFYWPYVAFLSAGIPLTAVVLQIIFLPETPTWYLTQNRRNEARAALQWVRDPESSAEEIDQELAHLGGVTDDAGHPTSKWAELKRPSALKPLALITFFFYTYQFSGIAVLTFYNVQIIESTGARVDADQAAVSFAVLRLFCNVIGCYLMTVCNRRTMTIASGVASGAAVLSLATHNYLNTIAVASDDWLWRHLPIFCLVSFYISYSLGYLLIPWVLTGEIYPARIRGLLGGITVCFAHSLLFAAVKSFPFLLENLGFHGTFWFYGCNVAVGSVILFILLPETRGRTLLQIESYFKKARSNGVY